MFQNRLSFRKLLLVAVISLQVFIIFIYILWHKQIISKYEKKNRTSIVSFITLKQNLTYNINSPLFFVDISNYYKLPEKLTTKELYIDFNSTICYRNGTNVKLMQHTNNWKCECLTGYHGPDCGQPEVLWRALLAQHKLKMPILKPRKQRRKLVYLMEFNSITATITDIRISELSEVVDLFILYNHEKSNEMYRRLELGFLKHFHHQILYLNVQYENLWPKIKQFLSNNFSKDDLIISSQYQEIPNLRALEFFKLYDSFPESINFRMRWSVYGFFWMHPNMTIVRPGLFTVRYLMKNFVDLQNSKHVNATKFTVGDLNHYGGWFCEYCNDPTKIISELAERNSSAILKNAKTMIDVEFIENLIDRGIYVDSKVELFKRHRYNDNYFAPQVLLDNIWKYEYLMINIYSKMDYYEQ